MHYVSLSWVCECRNSSEFKGLQAPQQNRACSEQAKLLRMDDPTIKLITDYETLTAKVLRVL